MVSALFLATAPAIQGQTSVVDIRVSGEHRRLPGDSADVATRLAIVDGRHKARQAVVARLRGRDDVAALRLETDQLEAYSAAITEFEPTSAPATPSASIVRIEIRSRVDAAEAARRMAALRKDQDITVELIAVWTRIQQLHRELADQTRTRSASATDVSALAEQQLRVATALDVADLTARAYAALARTEPVTVGGRATPAAGRERARQLAEAALTISPDSADARYLLGDWLFAADDPAAAEVEYRKAVAADGGSTVGRIKLASALRYQGKVSEALVELGEAQQMDPASARAYRELAMIMRAQKNLPESIAAYREAVRLDPDSIDAHNGLAVTLANSGRLEEAIAEFREIVRIDPDSAVGYYNLAYALADADRDVESAAALREVIRINPNHYNARYNLGELFRLEAKYDDSAAQFREYLRLAPDTPQNRRNITRAQGFVRQFEDPDAPPVVDTMAPRQPK